MGLAVSGGGDSVALMHLARRLCPDRAFAVVTVDHGLRPEAAAEAAEVARAALALGLPHDTLCWHGWEGQGNLQDAARQARQRLIGGWAAERGIGAVALGHTFDDQAETVLLRLARGSGVDGLAGMAERRHACGIDWLRPLLRVTRAELRAWLRGQGIGWTEDPSNDDPRFDRVRARTLLAAAGDLGISAQGLVDTAHRMTAARNVLAQAAADAADRLVTVTAGAIRLAPGWAELADETRWRLLSAALCQVAHAPYRPALAALRAAETEAASGRARTLHGCLIVPERGGLRIQPEPKALAGLTAAPGGCWNGWRIEGPDVPGAQVAMLGEDGLRGLPDWRDAGLPRDLAMTTPGLWRGTTLVAAPALLTEKWAANLTWDKVSFTASIISD